MTEAKELITDFLAQKNIAVVGVSTKRNSPANAIYTKLKNKGYSVYPVNPNMDTFAGDPCYKDLSSVPEKVDGVFVLTKPAVTEIIVEACIENGIKRIWMHNMLGTEPKSWKDSTSVSEAGVQKGREAGLSVITGSCPMQYVDPDIIHKCIYYFTKITGNHK